MSKYTEAQLRRSEKDEEIFFGIDSVSFKCIDTLRFLNGKEKKEGLSRYNVSAKHKP